MNELKARLTTSEDPFWYGERHFLFGHMFESEQDARWAVFFELCNAEWVYLPELAEFKRLRWDTEAFVPEFLLRNCDGRAGVQGNLFVTVDSSDRVLFCGTSKKLNGFIEPTVFDQIQNIGMRTRALIIVGDILAFNDVNTTDDFRDAVNDEYAKSGYSHYSFVNVDGDDYPAHPGMNKNGKFEFFGDDCSYLCDRNDNRTMEALRAAQQLQFEEE